MAMGDTRILLIAQMKRALELLESDENLQMYDSRFAELSNKLHEIRRDSIRYAKEVRPWTK